VCSPHELPQLSAARSRQVNTMHAGLGGTFPGLGGCSASFHIPRTLRSTLKGTSHLWVSLEVGPEPPK
jgi:hypothetical protein